jgi:hypothetical protein
VDTYDKGLRDLAKSVSVELGYGNIVREGTYVMIGGPTFETVAESRLLRVFGADAVGKFFFFLFVFFFCFVLLLVRGFFYVVSQNADNILKWSLWIPSFVRTYVCAYAVSNISTMTAGILRKLGIWVSWTIPQSFFLFFACLFRFFLLVFLSCAQCACEKNFLFYI